ncbi:hypothetical protein [Bacillus cereus group sp. BfR-BA-01394]|uniref:hypothetical protein n=1 Tax=Bacillus cereus group sp. BfR-BA-01394 TaxID=2920331 RepID=UPI001F577F1D
MKRLNRNKKLLVLATSIGCIVFNTEIPTYASSEMGAISSEQDFKPNFRNTDKEEAKIYSKNRYEKWSENFSLKEKKIVESFKKPSPTNELLRK